MILGLKLVMVPPSPPPRACPFGSSLSLVQLMCLVGCIKDPPNPVFLTAFLNGTRGLLLLPPASLLQPPRASLPREAGCHILQFAWTKASESSSISLRPHFSLSANPVSPTSKMLRFDTHTHTHTHILTLTHYLYCCSLHPGFLSRLSPGF